MDIVTIATDEEALQDEEAGEAEDSPRLRHGWGGEENVYLFTEIRPLVSKTCLDA